jgi:hypothetical protein
MALARLRPNPCPGGGAAALKANKAFGNPGLFGRRDTGTVDLDDERGLLCLAMKTHADKGPLRCMRHRIFDQVDQKLRKEMPLAEDLYLSIEIDAQHPAALFDVWPESFSHAAGYLAQRHGGEFLAET